MSSNTGLQSPCSIAVSGIQIQQLSTLTFIFYIMFLMEMLLHLSARIPGIAVIRPTLLIIMITTGLIFTQKKVFKKREKSPINKALFVLIAYLFISLPLVEYAGSVARDNWQLFLKAIVFFYFTAAIVDSPKRFKIFLFVYVGCQVFRVLEPLYLNVTEGYWGSSTYIGSDEFADRLAGAPSDVINANELGFVIVTAIPFLHFLLFPRGWICKLLYAGMMACLLYALILTMSRGAFLALLVVAWIIFKESKRKLPLIALGIAMLVVAISIMSPIQRDRYLSLVDSDSKGSATRDGRINGMIKTFELAMGRPIVGHGLGTTPEVKYQLLGSSQASHNMYSELFLEIGMVGMILFFRFIGAVYFEVKRVKQIVDPNNVEVHRMKNVIVALFFMFALYSLNYWGLSQGYWYLLAGLTVAFLRIVKMQAGNDLYQPLTEASKR